MGLFILRKMKMANTSKRTFPASQKTVKFSNHWTMILKHRGKSLDKYVDTKYLETKPKYMQWMKIIKCDKCRFTCIYISLYNKTMYRDRPVKFVHNKFLKTFFYKKYMSRNRRHKWGRDLVKIEILYLHLVNVRSLRLFLILYKNASHGFSLQSSHFFEFGVLDIIFI